MTSQYFLVVLFQLTIVSQINCATLQATNSDSGLNVTLTSVANTKSEEDLLWHQSFIFVAGNMRYALVFTEDNHFDAVKLGHAVGGKMIGENEVEKVSNVVDEVLSLFVKHPSIPLTYWLASDNRNNECLVLFINTSPPGYTTELTACDVNYGSMYTLGRV